MNLSIRIFTILMLALLPISSTFASGPNKLDQAEARVLEMQSITQGMQSIINNRAHSNCLSPAEQNHLMGLYNDLSTTVEELKTLGREINNPSLKNKTNRANANKNAIGGHLSTMLGSPANSAVFPRNATKLNDDLQKLNTLGGGIRVEIQTIRNN